MPTRRDDWLDEDEYPSDRDIEEFGDADRVDDDPLTIGKVRMRKRIPGYRQPAYWTTRRIIVAVVAAFLLIVFVLGELSLVFGW